MQRNKIRRALVATWAAVLVVAATATAQPAHAEENIVGVWQTNYGSINLKADGTYRGVVIDYLTGERHSFSGTYRYADNRLELGGERAWVEWHNENKITVTVVASPYRDYPRYPVTYTKVR